MSSISIQCGWQVCRRVTRHPSGICWQHQRSHASATPPSLPVAPPTQAVVTRPQQLSQLEQAREWQRQALDLGVDITHLRVDQANHLQVTYRGDLQPTDVAQLLQDAEIGDGLPIQVTRFQDVGFEVELPDGLLMSGHTEGAFSGVVSICDADNRVAILTFLDGYVLEVEVAATHRRRGLATAMYAAAQEHLGTFDHSTARTGLGNAWAASLGESDLPSHAAHYMMPEDYHFNARFATAAELAEYLAELDEPDWSVDDDPNWVLPTASVGLQRLADEHYAKLEAGARVARDLDSDDLPALEAVSLHEVYTRQELVNLRAVQHYLQNDQLYDPDGWYGNDHPIVVEIRPRMYALLDGTSRTAASQLKGAAHISCHVIREQPA